MKRYPLTYIIILNWNGWQDTLACVESCRELTWPNFRIIVVDNASTDGSEEQLRQQLSDEEIIQSGANLGFAGGNNIGIRCALECGADYVWLLNNDAVADPQALTMLIEAAERNPNVAMAGSKIYFHDDPCRIWSVSGIWEKGWLRLRMKGAHQLDRGQFDEPCKVWSISGCSMLVRSAAIREIGMLDEPFFLYWEDVEWCARAREHGYDVLYVPKSLVWHKVSVSTRQGSFQQYYYHTRNGLFFLKRNDPLLLPLFIFYNVTFGLRSMFLGNPQPLKGLFCGILDSLVGIRGPLTTPGAKRANVKNHD